jgi:hypothetical protein
MLDSPEILGGASFTGLEAGLVSFRGSCLASLRGSFGLLPEGLAFPRLASGLPGWFGLLASDRWLD